MNIRFLIPGKAREEFLKSGFDEYLKRISKYARVSLVYIQEEPLSNRPSQKEISGALDKEADKMLRQIKDDEILFLLDVHAPLFSTDELAKAIETSTMKNGNMVFLVGSSYGLSDIIRKRANVSFSLSKMTFTHYMAMLLCMEQVYRSMKINHNETYDK